MAKGDDASRNSGGPDDHAGGGTADPAALSVAQLAGLLGLAEGKVRQHSQGLDYLVGCAAASQAGVTAPGQAPPPAPRQRRRYTQEDLRRR